MFLSLVPPGAPPRPANLSRAYDYWMRSCVRANPAYKIVLWTRDDCDRLIATRHPKYAQFYNETLCDDEDCAASAEPQLRSQVARGARGTGRARVLRSK